jgi:hypothetical protein
MVTDSAERKRSTRLKPLSFDAAAAPAALPPSSRGHHLDAPELYLNRELTWLAFNRRVLHEAQDERTPLLERVTFLAIVHSNQFFMKRIGALKQQLGAGVQTPKRTGDPDRAGRTTPARSAVIDLAGGFVPLKRWQRFCDRKQNACWPSVVRTADSDPRGGLKSCKVPLWANVQ